MNRFILLIFFLVIISCSPKGYWMSQNSYRAKNPRYKLSKEKFTSSNLIDTNFLYEGNDSLIMEGNKSLKSIIGFNSDGTAFLNSYSTDEEIYNNLRYTSTDSAQQIGHYRIEGTTIRFERLVPYDFGQYVVWKGDIKGDTIEFSFKNFPNKSKKYVFIKSEFPK